jgi:hypothetical protein
MYLSHSQKTRRNAERIQANGHKIQPDKTVNAWKVPATSEYPAPHGRPDYMWMETGSDRAGLGHLQQPSRVRNFANAGIPASEQREKLPVLAEAHTTVGRHVGYSGRDRPVMATYIDGQVHKTAVTVGNNGFVVGMNPVSRDKFKVKEGDPGEISDRTMQNLYHYPPNRPDRRATQEAKQSGRLRPPRRDGTV